MLSWVVWVNFADLLLQRVVHVVLGPLRIGSSAYEDCDVSLANFNELRRYDLIMRHPKHRGNTLLTGSQKRRTIEMSRK